jgi:hypothetical protein
MGTDVKVTAPALQTVASGQRDASAVIGQAEQATDGATFHVARTHGLVCSLSIEALAAAQLSRSDAAAAMQGVSNTLADRLDTGATNYTSTDQQQQGEVDQQVRPR